MNMQEFALGDILSITTGCLVSRRRIHGMYDILNFMVDGNLYTHQLTRASKFCRPALLEQHPQLKGVLVPDKFEGEDHVWEWLTEQELTYGETLAVKPLSAGVYTHIDPIEELVSMTGGAEKVILFDPNNPEASINEVVDIIIKKMSK